MRYAIDYQGWLYVEATDEKDAMNKGLELLSDTLHYDYTRGEDWEITNVEAVDD